MAASSLVVEYVPLDTLRPYARNARTHSKSQIAKLERSLRAYGWTVPMAVAGPDVLAGHGRLAAAIAIRDKGETIPGLADPATAPVIDLSYLSPRERRAYILADNKIAADAGWDNELLIEELGEMLADGGLDDLATGFDTDELDRLLNGPPADNVDRPAGGGKYSEQYGVIVVCRDAAHQERVYDELLAAGHSCKVVTT